MAELKRRLDKAAVPVVAAPFDVPFGGIWFQDLHGDWINVQIAEPAPVFDVLPSEINAHGRYRRVGRPAIPAVSIRKRCRCALGI